MLWKEVNLEDELKRERKKHLKKSPDGILDAIKSLIEEKDKADETVLEQIFESNDTASTISWERLEADKIFSIDQIKIICTNYRLRFLDAKYFKGEIPYEAIAKIKKLQKQEGQLLENFKIIAPASMFHLEHQDKDPLLFVQLGNDRYYLVHKWGNDLHPLRKLLVFPFRSFKTILFSVALLAFLVMMSFPDRVMMGPFDKGVGMIRIVFFFYLFLAFSGLTALYGFSRVKNFNNELWNSRNMD